ncbi:MAG TPA: hypothetical protein VFH51_12925, partial [Myxococcota bacterium]|nr:hypothetical protein [Myxococcota bacterium]
LLGDYRYTLVAANMAAGALIAFTRPSPWATCAMATFLFTPRALFIMENGWIEPFAALLLVGTAWAALQRPTWAPYGLGLLLASKQYVILLMASAVLLPVWPADRDGRLRFAGKALVAAAAVTLPFFLWSPTAFWHSVMEAPAKHPFRSDALNFLAWYRQRSGTTLPFWLGFVAAVGASYLAYRRAPRSLAGFAYAFGFIFLVFIAFNRQAFCNYYYLIIAAMCAAAAFSGRAEEA